MKEIIYLAKDFCFTAYVVQYKAMVKSHLEYAGSMWCPYKKVTLKLLKKYRKRATKLIISINHLSYIERLKQLKFPTLKYRRL